MNGIAALFPYRGVFFNEDFPSRSFFIEYGIVVPLIHFFKIILFALIFARYVDVKFSDNFVIRRDIPVFQAGDVL